MIQRVAGVTAILTALAWAAAAEPPLTLEAKKGKNEVRTLWAGSSSLYYHNMPDVFTQCKTSAVCSERDG